jgi:hypothetical protein
MKFYQTPAQPEIPMGDSTTLLLILSCISWIDLDRLHLGGGTFLGHSMALRVSFGGGRNQLCPTVRFDTAL